MSLERDWETGSLKTPSRHSLNSKQLADEYGIELGKSVLLFFCWHDSGGVRGERSTRGLTVSQIGRLTVDVAINSDSVRHPQNKEALAT